MIKTGQVCHSSGRLDENNRPINEDKLLVFSVPYENENINFTILMDGATGLGRNFQIIPGWTSAEWYVNFLADNLYQMFQNDPTRDVKEVIEECLVKAIDVIDNYEKESGSKLEEYENHLQHYYFKENIKIMLNCYY